MAQAALLIEHERGGWSWASVEIHQMRTAARRLRSTLDTFQLLLDEDWATQLRAELRWIRECLGRVRDLDVLLARLESMLESRSGGPPRDLISLIEARRFAERLDLRVVLDSPRYRALRSQLVDISAGTTRWRSSPTTNVPGTSSTRREPTISQVARASFRRLEKAVARYKRSRLETEDQPASRRSFATVSGPSAGRLGAMNEDLHRVRKRLRSARYAAESLIPLLPVRQQLSARRFVKTASEMQDLLGVHQDHLVLREHLH